MNDKEYAAETIYNEFISIINVNIDTGSFNFVKHIDKNNVPYENIEDYLFCENRICCIDKNFVQLYKDFVSLKTKDENKMQMLYKHHEEHGYSWRKIEIIKPSAFTQENPVVVYTERIYTDMEKLFLESGKNMINYFHKILLVNLKNDKYSIVKLYNGEKPNTQYAQGSLTGWLKEFYEEDNIFSEDLENYARITNIEYLRNFFSAQTNDGHLKINYRRKIDNEYRWVSLEMVKTEEYCEENPTVMLFIRDIHNEKLEIIQNSYKDGMTGIQNKFAYEQFCNNFSKNNKNTSLGIIYSDLNGLKYINDTFGHETGDKYITSFSNLLSMQFGSMHSYRIGGDEFIAILQNIAIGEFEALVSDFKSKCEQSENINVATGAIWSDDTASIKALISTAEKMMYGEKELAHKQNPIWNRA